MNFDPLRIIHLGLGFAEYMRENFDSLSEEFVERGRRKSEDIRDFVGDLADTLPFNRRKDDAADFESGKAGFDLMSALGIRKQNEVH